MAHTEPSPANNIDAPKERTRNPLGAPRQQLSTNDIPGYKTHWFRGTEQRLQAALDGGYEFVQKQEVRGRNSHILGGATETDGNTDMGSRVSHISGETLDAQGQPERLYLMKIRQEWFNEDQEMKEERNQALLRALKKGSIGAEKDESSSDTAARYAKVGDTMFTPRRISRS